MSSLETFLWHDYETWGLNPRADRPSQFAGIRTNAELEIIDEEVMVYCRPSGDFIPHPDSVLITGLLPQVASEKGLMGRHREGGVRKTLFHATRF